MRAITLHSYGPPENLHLDEYPDPVPRPGEVRLAVHAAGVHFMETALRRGQRVGPHPAPPLPAVLGGEVAGVVDMLGPGVDATWLGRRVVASTGGYASLAVASEGLGQGGRESCVWVRGGDLVWARVGA